MWCCLLILCNNPFHVLTIVSVFSLKSLTSCTLLPPSNTRTPTHVGILRALASNPDQQEAVARARPGAGGAESALKQLVAAALGGPASVQVAAAGVLATLTRSQEVRGEGCRAGSGGD
jgi:hypothetical protein